MKSPLKSRSFSSISIAALLAIVFVIAGSVYWFWAKSPLALFRGGSVVQPTAAMFVPRNSPAMVSLLVNPDRLQALRQLRTPWKRRGASRTEFDRLKRSLLAQTDLNYDRDIKPWLGDEITVAVTRLDVDRDRTNGGQPGYLVSLAVKNPEKSREFLDIFWQERANAGAELTFEDYKGVKLISSQPGRQLFKSRRKSQKFDLNPFSDAKSAGWASAVVGDRFVLFANSVEELRQAINRVQAADLNLTRSSTYQQAIDNLPQNPLGIAYLDVAQLNGWLGNTKTPTTLSQPLAVALSANTKGLLADALWLGDTHPQETLPALSHPVDALRYIPQEGALVIAGKDLDGLWQRITATEGAPLSGLFAQILKPLESNWEISLSQDIFSWVTGEYALGLFPGDDANAANWVFVAQQGDRTQEGVEKLDKIAVDRGYSVGTFTLDEHDPIYAWTQLKAETTTQTNSEPKLKLEAEVLGVCGSAEGYEIFANSVPAIDRVLNAPNQGSILKNAEFSTGLSLLPEENNGYLYMNWNDSKSTLEQKLPIVRFLELTASPFFQHLRSATTASTPDPAGFLKTQLFFTFNR
ncbi:MAG: DUF3352 domain-containing protein [Geitlerinemataceae cyanobacterium]